MYKFGIKNFIYSLEDVEKNLLLAAETLQKPYDSQNIPEILEKKETYRNLLPIVSKCYLTIDYNYRILGSKSGQEYALLASLREYASMIKKDLENSLMHTSNSLNFLKNEKH